MHHRSPGLLWPLLLLATLTTLAPQAVVSATPIQLEYQGTVASVPTTRGGIELMPVIRLLGGESRFSPAAGTYLISVGEHLLQVAPGTQYVVADGALVKTEDTPSASPGGVAVSLQFLDDAILNPLGLHLERSGTGWQIAAGGKAAELVTAKVAAADFAATTTLVVTLDRSLAPEVETTDGTVTIHLTDLNPQLDPSMPLRSRRVQSVTVERERLIINLASGVGVLTWHTLDDPTRIYLELGERRPTPTPAADRPSTETSSRRPIVIDPGHGGDDVGASSGSGIQEKHLVLNIAERLADELSQSGYPVRLTRSGDEHRALRDRTALANRLDARIFISLHANASSVRSVRGAETYYMSLDQTATDEAAAATAALENKVQREPRSGSSLDMILWDMAQAAVLNESARLALAVQRQLNSSLEMRDRGVKQAPFVVLTGATMPAILIEVGFLTNPEEAVMLATPEHQQRLARTIADGVLDYLDQVE
jgi:N-acetylmuramoyl-L-alanine amidase